MSKILSIIDTAYRATQEEQDDAALWVNRALVNAGAGIDILLQGSAVSYAIGRQDPSGLVIGSVPVERPAVPPQDLLALQATGFRVFVDLDDVLARGIDCDRLRQEFHQVSKEEVVDLLPGYEQVWHW